MIFCKLVEAGFEPTHAAVYERVTTLVSASAEQSHHDFTTGVYQFPLILQVLQNGQIAYKEPIPYNGTRSRDKTCHP